ncbi:MAG TPA: zinc ribbon domain-containing protein [Candidatus Acidoferrales bacterium]
MPEIRCRRCGAVFTSLHDGAVCPYCGAEPVSKLSALFSFFAMHWIVFVLVALFIVIERPSASVWAVVGLFVALVVAGLIVFGVDRLGGNKRPNEPLQLDLGAGDSSIRPQALPTPMRPPKVPEKWRALMESRPPRDVYLPSKIWTNFLVEGVTLLFAWYVFASKAAKHHLTLIGFISTFVDPATTGTSLVYVATWIVRLKKLLTTREILRDGEVTMAYTVDRSWNRATYQFWTQTGQIFERRTSVVQRKEFRAGEFATVPVFYVAADPRRSVALYGTEFLIRLPVNSATQQLNKAPASA